MGSDRFKNKGFVSKEWMSLVNNQKKKQEIKDHEKKNSYISDRFNALFWIEM